MGVAQYTWATSPLRRYVDLVNQWQIIACARHGATAALVAAFKPKDATLFSIISGFDGAYTAYNAFQNGIERFWTLRWLDQNEVTELEASVMKDGLVRADTLPLVLRATGTESLPRGARVRVRITGCDLLTLDVWGELVARLLREERSAMDSREYARQQALLNQLVIEEMGEGVLVLNRQGRVLAANPAARALLGLTDPPAGAQPPGVVPQAYRSTLLEAVERAHAQGSSEGGSRLAFNKYNILVREYAVLACSNEVFTSIPNRV
jgi:PAS domain-containing protein